jgi:hypothetical protein
MPAEVAKREAAVPDLVRTPALEITAEDIQLPRLYIGHYSSDIVQSGAAGAGDIYVAQGKDDMDPVVLAKSEGKFPSGVNAEKGPVIHVVGLRKGKSDDSTGDLVLYDYDDPSAPSTAWVTYNYTVVIPEYDTEVPVKWLLTKSGRSTAQRINTVLKKNEAKGPAWLSAFRLGSTGRQNDKGKWFVPVLQVVEAEQANIETSERLALMVAGSTGAVETTGGDEPAI